MDTFPQAATVENTFPYVPTIENTLLQVTIANELSGMHSQILRGFFNLI